MNAYVRLFSFLVLASLLGFAAVPRVTSVEPNFGKPGDELVVNGQSLEAVNVAKLFLTAEGKDHEVEIKDQTAEKIRFSIPAELQLGRYNLTIQTGGASPAIMVQPIYCSVVDEEGAKKMAESAKQELVIIEQKAEEEQSGETKKEGK